MLGLHPTEVTAGYSEILKMMEQRLSTSGRTFIGIGEVGLDYYWDRTYYLEQQDAFVAQVNWAMQYGLPLMIHSRSAQRELVDILLPYRSKQIRGVFHSFGGSRDDAEELLSFDHFMIGINGVLTFKKATLQEVLNDIPLERVVLETDAPYLAPVPCRGRRNESSLIYHTLVKMAEVYGLPVDEVAQKTYENAMKVFPLAR